MAITPFRVGETHVKLSLTWQNDAGAAIDLTGATITVRYQNLSTAAASAGTGTVTVTSAPAGTLTYAFSAADCGTAGSFAYQFKAVFADATVLYSDPIQIQFVSPE